MKFWIKCASLLAGVWILAAIVIYWVDHMQPTAKSVSAYLKRTDIAAQSGRERAKTIASVEDQFNGLSMEERQQLERSGENRRFFEQMTDDERLAFLDATLPSGFKQMMEAFNKMEPAKRKEFVTKAVEDMKKHEGEAPPPGQDDKMAQHVIDQGMRSFYRDADADTKLDMAPLIEQLQRNFQNAGQ
jgi:hypothetical protein